MPQSGTTGTPLGRNGARLMGSLSKRRSPIGPYGHRSVLADRNEEGAQPVAGLATGTAAAGVAERITLEQTGHK